MDSGDSVGVVGKETGGLGGRDEGVGVGLIWSIVGVGWEVGGVVGMEVTRRAVGVGSGSGVAWQAVRVRVIRINKMPCVLMGSTAPRRGTNGLD